MVCVLGQGLSLARQAEEEHVRDLRSDSPAVRENAAVSLGRLLERSATTALADTPAGTPADTFVGTLVDAPAGTPAGTPVGTLVDALVGALGDRDAGVRREAAKALGFVKPGPATAGPAAAALARALVDRDANVRLYAAYALGEIRDPKTAGALIEALNDPEWCVRDQAAWALGELVKPGGLGGSGGPRDPDVAGRLAAALGRENADVPHVMWVLGQLGGERAVAALGALLDDADPKVRLRAVRALDGLENEGALGPLITALADGEADVRLRAARALLKTGDDRALEALRELAAREDDPAVREAAEEAVLRLSRHGSLAAHWSFDDPDGLRVARVAKDVTGRGTDAEVHGCRPVGGKVGHALEFGRDAYVEIGRPAGLPIANRPFTVSAWVRPTGRNGVVVARGGAFCGYSLYVKDGVAKFGIHRVKDGPTYIAAGREEVVGSWVHLAGVVTEKRIELYVDGRRAAAAETPGYIPSDCGQGMEIGFDVANSPAEITDHFEGVIDEVKVFDAALSEVEIAKEARAAE